MEVRNDGVYDERLPADMAFNDLSAGRLMGVRAAATSTSARTGNLFFGCSRPLLG